MIRNHHSRCIQATVAQAEALLARLGSDQDGMWPKGRWPAMRFEGGLRPGAEGGHGPIRYVVEHLDARHARFRFTGPRGFEGWHGFELAPDEISGVRIIHRLHMKAEGRALFAWAFVFRWLHDACQEDLLDRAQATLEGTPWAPRPLPLHVRALRRLMGGSAARARAARESAAIALERAV
ncbi:MAG TPA: hypothetical protein VJ483_10065 [Holophagaceae bacterium]|nr:hypothetical protein [Holophagaceae bacterium]